MSLAVWAERDGVARVTAYRWFDAGVLPVPARKVGRLILVDAPAGQAGPRARTACVRAFCRLVRKRIWIGKWRGGPGGPTAEQVPVDKVVTEVGSAVDGHRRKFLALLRDPSVGRIVVVHRERFCRFGSECVEAALAAQGRELVVVDSAGGDDDLVRDMTEILTSRCARLYGERAAADRAQRAVAAAAVAGQREAA